MSDVEVKYLGEMQRIEFGPDDLMVVSFPGPIAAADADRIKAQLAQYVGIDHGRVLVFGDGAKIGVLGKDQPAP